MQCQKTTVIHRSYGCSLMVYGVSLSLMFMLMTKKKKNCVNINDLTPFSITDFFFPVKIFLILKEAGQAQYKLHVKAQKTIRAKTRYSIGPNTHGPT